MVRKNTMTIKAVKRGNGYRLVDDNNKLLPQTNEVFKTKSDAYYACSKMWPSNSVWHGKKVSSGYKIDLD